MLAITPTAIELFAFDRYIDPEGEEFAATYGTPFELGNAVEVEVVTKKLWAKNTTGLAVFDETFGRDDAVVVFAEGSRCYWRFSITQGIKGFESNVDRGIEKFDMPEHEFAFDEELESLVFSGGNKLLYNTVHLMDFSRKVTHWLLPNLPHNEIAQFDEETVPAKSNKQPWATDEVLRHVSANDFLQNLQQMRDAVGPEPEF